MNHAVQHAKRALAILAVLALHLAATPVAAEQRDSAMPVIHATTTSKIPEPPEPYL